MSGTSAMQTYVKGTDRTAADKSGLFDKTSEKKSEKRKIASHKERSPFSDTGQSLDNISVFSSSDGIIQKKSLRKGEAGDKYEKEADMAASHILNGGSVLRSAGFSSSRGVSAPFVNLSLPNSGKKLNENVKTDMESGFGRSFDDVRIHNENASYKTAESLGARAFTVGNNIYFGKGEYNVSSSEGRGVLAHELAHVVQQGDMGYEMMQMVQKKEKSPKSKILEEINDKLYKIDLFPLSTISDNKKRRTIRNDIAEIKATSKVTAKLSTLEKNKQRLDNILKNIEAAQQQQPDNANQQVQQPQPQPQEHEQVQQFNPQQQPQQPVVVPQQVDGQQNQAELARIKIDKINEEKEIENRKEQKEEEAIKAAKEERNKAKHEFDYEHALEFLEHFQKVNNIDDIEKIEKEKFSDVPPKKNFGKAWNSYKEKISKEFGSEIVSNICFAGHFFEETGDIPKKLSGLFNNLTSQEKLSLYQKIDKTNHKELIELDKRNVDIENGNNLELFGNPEKIFNEAGKSDIWAVIFNGYLEEYGEEHKLADSIIKPYIEKYFLPGIKYKDKKMLTNYEVDEDSLKKACTRTSITFKGKLVEHIKSALEGKIIESARALKFKTHEDNNDKK